MFILITRNYNSSAKFCSCSFVPALNRPQMTRSYFPLMATALPLSPLPHTVGKRKGTPDCRPAISSVKILTDNIYQKIISFPKKGSQLWVNLAKSWFLTHHVNNWKGNLCFIKCKITRIPFTPLVIKPSEIIKRWCKWAWLILNNTISDQCLWSIN